MIRAPAAIVVACLAGLGCGATRAPVEYASASYRCSRDEVSAVVVEVMQERTGKAFVRGVEVHGASIWYTHAGGRSGAPWRDYSVQLRLWALVLPRDGEIVVSVRSRVRQRTPNRGVVKIRRDSHDMPYWVPGKEQAALDDISARLKHCSAGAFR